MNLNCIHFTAYTAQIRYKHNPQEGYICVTKEYMSFRMPRFTGNKTLSKAALNMGH